MILIVGAMHEELKGMIEGFNLEEVTTHRQITLYSGKINHNDILVLQTGIGKTNAAMSLASVLSLYQIKEIINIGIVGATKPYLSGETLLVNKATYHDFDLQLFGYEKGQVPKLPLYYVSDETLKTRFNAFLKVREANLYTGDSFTLKTDLTGIFDMEGTALYQVAFRFNTPMLSIKMVSDVIGEKSQHEDYKRFEQNCSIHLFQIINQYLLEV